MSRTRTLCMLFLLLVLLALRPVLSEGAFEVALGSDTVCIGETVSFSVNGAEGPFRYAMYLGSTQLFQVAETDRTSGAYIPKKPGSYLFRATDLATGSEKDVPFTVTGELTLSMSGPEEALAAGDAAVFFAEASGGDGPYTYQFTVTENRVTLYGRTSLDGQFVYTAAKPCELTVHCTVTDRQGTSASAQQHLIVSEGPGLSADGDLSPFYLYGGTRTFVVHAPGIWTASCDDDFIRLSTDCGADGGELDITVLPDAKTAAQGSVSIVCGATRIDLPITRLATDGIEKEVSLRSSEDTLTVDGENLFVWTNAEGARNFSIVSASPWYATCEESWIHADVNLDGNLSVSVDPCPGAARSGHIHVTNDAAHAYISIYQPSIGLTASVTDVILDASAGLSYQDTLTARVWLSADADRLIVYTSSRAEPITFEKKDVRISEDGMWTVRIPLEMSGQEEWLFAAQNFAGIGSMQLVTVSALMEEAMFASESAKAVLDEDECTITVRVTSSVSAVALLNESSAEYGTVLDTDADIDQYISPANHGRYADWTITLPKEHVPSALRIGRETVPVVVEEKERPIPVFNQFDGSWADVSYRHSSLETSGCAIFTLSSALYRLGFTGDDIRPENLAKTYAFCLVDGGTLNSTLVGNAAKAFGFRTRYNLYEDKKEIVSLFEQGALFSFSIVKGHIALADGLSEDQSMVHIVDSALSATFTRIDGTRLFNREADGAFTPVSDLEQIPGAVYYPETDAYSGGSYWLPIDYVVSRGVRLILLK